MLVWKAARNKANDVRKAYRLETPVDLKQLCDELGIGVWVGDLKGASGLIVKEKGEDPNIYLERTDGDLRQRFTLAHELGHYFERIKANDDSYSFRDEGVLREARSDKYGLMEFYADEFAGELLMPETEFLEIWENGEDVAAAAHFRVSPAAARKRYMRLQKSQNYRQRDRA